MWLAKSRLFTWVRFRWHVCNANIVFLNFVCLLNLAITIGVRILGPAAGFILGSFCTRLYVDLSDPGFGPSDPKWVGAWYLGKRAFTVT